MNNATRDLLVKIQDNLINSGYKVMPEIEDYIAANRADFIGTSIQHENFVHRFAAHKTDTGAGDVRATMIHLILTESFHQTGIDGNTLIFSPVKELWQ